MKLVVKDSKVHLQVRSQLQFIPNQSFLKQDVFQDGISNNSSWPVSTVHRKLFEKQYLYFMWPHPSIFFWKFKLQTFSETTTKFLNLHKLYFSMNYYEPFFLIRVFKNLILSEYPIWKFFGFSIHGQSPNPTRTRHEILLTRGHSIYTQQDCSLRLD